MSRESYSPGRRKGEILPDGLICRSQGCHQARATLPPKRAVVYGNHSPTQARTGISTGAWHGNSIFDGAIHRGDAARGTPAIVTLAAMAALTALTADAAPKQARPAPPTEAAAPRDAGEPIMAIVSIKTQQVTFYDADGWILRAPVSTGTKGRETPAGVFAVVEKNKDHRSNMYDDAQMPNMQRITWNGIALHGGPLPGYAASHGCVRMPFGFAEKLFDKTRIGMRVIISPNDAEPVEFSHPALLVPNAEAIAAAPARAEALAREAAEAARTADEAKKAAATAPRETAALTASLRKLEGLKTRADAELAAPTRRSPPPKPTKPRRGPRSSSKRPPPGPRNWRRSSTPPGPTRNRSSSRRRRKGRRQGGRDKKADTAKAASEAKLALEPVSIFISRATQKALRAAQHAQAGAGRRRQGVRYDHRGSGRDPRCRQADRHACVHGDGAQRCGPALDRGHDRHGDDARSALDRITIPKDVLDRIAPTALPRSSIVISDEPLSGETNYRTEFVAVLSNQPQGGFITRERRPRIAASERRPLRLLFPAQSAAAPTRQCAPARRPVLSAGATRRLVVGRGRLFNSNPISVDYRALMLASTFDDRP